MHNSPRVLRPSGWFPVIGSFRAAVWAGSVLLAGHILTGWTGSEPLRGASASPPASPVDAESTDPLAAPAPATAHGANGSELWDGTANGRRLEKGMATPALRGVAWQISRSKDITGEARKRFAEIAELGANCVLLTAPGYWEYEWSERIQLDKESIPSAQQWREICTIAHDKHLRVILMPILQLRDSRTVDWRTTITVPDWDRWFERYTGFILHFAAIAADNGIEVLCIGSDLASSEFKEAHWRRLIQDVRRIYSGKLTYSANWDHYRAVQFWDALDFVGMNGSYPLAATAHPTEDQLHRECEATRNAILGWQSAIHKPILFTQVGWCSQEGASQEPWNPYRQAEATLEGIEEQRRCYRAFMDTWARAQEVAGIIWWEWTDATGGPNDSSYTPRGKAAEQELRGWFSHAR